MDLTDPAFLIALVLGVVGLVIFMKLRPRPPEPPRCPSCLESMDFEEEIVDPKKPELRYVPGERRGWFRCVDCHKRLQARY